MASPKLDRQLCFAVYSASHAFNKAYKPLLDPLGLTYPQYLVLMVLWSKDDQTVGAIGGQLFLDSSTLSPLLKRLEALGFVLRARDDRDERQVRVRLTPAGQKLSCAGEEVQSCIATKTEMPMAKLQILRRDLEELRGHLLKSG